LIPGRTHVRTHASPRLRTGRPARRIGSAPGVRGPAASGEQCRKATTRRCIHAPHWLIRDESLAQAPRQHPACSPPTVGPFRGWREHVERSAAELRGVFPDLIGHRRRPIDPSGTSAGRRSRVEPCEWAGLRAVRREGSVGPA